MGLSDNVIQTIQAARAESTTACYRPKWVGFRQRPVVHASALQLDLPLVLEALVTEPFEPLELSSLKALSWKTALLLALTSAKRVSELTALSVHPSCLMIRGDQSGATLRPNPSFVPKSLRSAFRSRFIQLGVLVFHPWWG